MFFCDQAAEQLERFLSFWPSQPLVPTRRNTRRQMTQNRFMSNIPTVRTVLLCGASPAVGMAGMAALRDLELTKARYAARSNEDAADDAARPAHLSQIWTKPAGYPRPKPPGPPRLTVTPGHERRRGPQGPRPGALAGSAARTVIRVRALVSTLMSSEQARGPTGRIPGPGPCGPAR